MKLFTCDKKTHSVGVATLSLCVVLLLLGACAATPKPESQPESTAERKKNVAAAIKTPPANDAALPAVPKPQPDSLSAMMSDSHAFAWPAAASEAARERDRTSEVLVYALSLVGVKYQFGGKSAATGFDCSGFVHHVFGEVANLALPRSAESMAQRGAAVVRDDLTAGDLVFYNTRSRANSHVGIYLGNNTFVHAPSRGKSVEVVDMSENYWRKRFNGARRLLPDANLARATINASALPPLLPRLATQKIITVKPLLLKEPDAMPVINGQ